MSKRITIRIPAPLRSYTGEAAELYVHAETVRQALAAAGERHQLMIRRVLTRDGELRPYVNLFLGDTDVRTLAALDTPTSDGDVLSIMPSVAGG